MYYSFNKYTVKTVKKRLKIDSYSFDSHVEISLKNEYGHQLYSFKRGVKEYKSILEEFKSNKKLIFDYCYIKDFDIEKLKEDLKILQDKVEVDFLSAEHSVFESNTFNNFSFINLTQDKLSFKNTYVLKGSLVFHNSTLAKESNLFSDIVFYSGEIDFSNVIFGIKVNSFKNSHFKEGFKNFQYANFSSGDADFTNTDFGEGNVSFINSNFSKAKPIFKVATFGKGKVDFHYAHFGKKNISFEKIDFGEGLIDFSKVDFGSGRVNFNRSRFRKGDVNFEGIDLILGKITFKRAEFIDNTINFSEAICKSSSIIFDSSTLGLSTLSFNKTIADRISFKSCHFNNYVDFRVNQIHVLDLGGSVVRDILDFIPYEDKVHIGILNMDGMRLIGKIFLDWNKNKVYDLIDNQNGADNSKKAYQYRILKENYHNTGEYEAEDKAYIQFKRSEAKAELSKTKQKGIWSVPGAYLSYYFKDLLLDKAGLYATAPIRVLFSMIVSYFFFSLLLIISALSKAGSLSGSTDFTFISIVGDSFYFSAITYLTVGYGDFCPVGIDKWIAAIEGFVGVFLMAYFTVAFVRRILR